MFVLTEALVFKMKKATLLSFRLLQLFDLTLANLWSKEGRGTLFKCITQCNNGVLMIQYKYYIIYDYCIQY